MSNRTSIAAACPLSPSTSASLVTAGVTSFRAVLV